MQTANVIYCPAKIFSHCTPVYIHASVQFVAACTGKMNNETKHKAKQYMHTVFCEATIFVVRQSESEQIVYSKLQAINLVILFFVLIIKII